MYRLQTIGVSRNIIFSKAASISACFLTEAFEKKERLYYYSLQIRLILVKALNHKRVDESLWRLEISSAKEGTVLRVTPIEESRSHINR